MGSELCLELGIGCMPAGEQNVGPCQCRLVVVGQATVLMVVVDLGNERFAESGLTGRDESDLASQPAVGDSGVAEPDQFLDVFADLASGPQRRVQAIESLA